MSLVFTIIIISIVLCLSILSAILYRFGGEGKKSNKLDFLRDTITRDLGCSFLSTLSIVILSIDKIQLTLLGICSLLLSWVLFYGALTTYTNKINSLFKLDTKKVYWFNWILTGMLYALALLPFTIYSSQWEALILRTLFLSWFTMIWSEKISIDYKEEWGRGFLLTISNLFYLIK